MIAEQVDPKLKFDKGFKDIDKQKFEELAQYDEEGNLINEEMIKDNAVKEYPVLRDKDLIFYLMGCVQHLIKKVESLEDDIISVKI